MPETAPRTVPELLLDRVKRTPDSEAFRYPDGAGWRSLTWKGTLDRIRAVACGLADLGLGREQRGAILSGTRVEWILADYGILCAGGATTTIYPSSTADECAFILADSGSAVAFAENDDQVRKLEARRAQLPSLRHVVTFDGKPTPDGWVLTLAELEDRGRSYDARHPGRFEEVAHALEPHSLATLIYTSGTTGPPKGVELTQDCWVSQSESIVRAGILDHPQAVQLFWLPLAHSFGKMIGTAQLRLGFPTAVDGRIEKIVENRATVRPTFVCAVPRIFEKVYAKLLATAREGGAVKQAIFNWAVGVGLEASRQERGGRRPGAMLRVQRLLADRLVFSKVRALFGGRLHFFVSGSAPLSRDIAEFFRAIGVLILEGYGLTESSAGTHCNLPWSCKIGTVGPPFAGIEVHIAEDGEILMRGPWIMRGYHGLAEQTREALQGGWLHTGDIGSVDADGHLTITDRKKDLIKTSGGKYVAPQELEVKLKALCPYVSQVLVHGDRRNYVTALVTLDEESTRKWAVQQGLGELTLPALADRPEVRALVAAQVERLNAGVPRYATIKRFAILSADFTEAAGEVTPSQKLKRKVIEQKYRAQLDALYPGNGENAGGRE